ncbi:MAG: isoprenylcysteine carboxylmethyltransferase family protein [Gammaproteobacteria bacterium]|nr:isoprenylcysteine carboxylmethyltransferase family protein [Gammaproteobacteria bacterium]
MPSKRGVLYGVVSYVFFLGVLGYLVLFAAELWVPWTAGSGVSEDLWGDSLFNLFLISLFGVQHSVMARPSFKAWWLKFVPEYLERSHYVMISTLVMLVVMVFWRPIGVILWQFENEVMVSILWAGFALGWLLTVFSTFLTDHFDLFGLRQVYLHYVEKTYTEVGFSEHLFYKLVRHPMMLGMLMGFWLTPFMTLGHLVLATGFSIYILVGIHFEERALLASLGEDYRSYREKTPKLFPKFIK